MSRSLLAPARPASHAAFLASKRSPATRRAYQRDLAAFLALLGVDPDDPAAASRALLDAGVGQIAGWRDAMKAAGLRPATIQRRLAALRTFYRFAISEGACASNPAASVESDRVCGEEQKRPFLESAEAAKLLAAPDLSTTRGLRDRAILGLLASVGLRRSEVAGLLCGAIRPTEDHRMVVTVQGKGHRIRTLDVDRETSEVLRAYLARDGRPLGKSATADPVFLASGGRRRALSAATIYFWVRHYAAMAGVRVSGGDRIAPHGLRRTFTTIALDRGVPIEKVSRALGHSTTGITSRYDRRREASVTVEYGAEVAHSTAPVLIARRAREPRRKIRGSVRPGGNPPAQRNAAPRHDARAPPGAVVVAWRWPAGGLGDLRARALGHARGHRTRRRSRDHARRQRHPEHRVPGTRMRLARPRSSRRLEPRAMKTMHVPWMVGTEPLPESDADKERELQAFRLVVTQAIRALRWRHRFRWAGTAHRATIPLPRAGAYIGPQSREIWVCGHCGAKAESVVVKWPDLLIGACADFAPRAGALPPG